MLNKKQLKTIFDDHPRPWTIDDLPMVGASYAIKDAKSYYVLSDRNLKNNEVVMIVGLVNNVVTAK